MRRNFKLRFAGLIAIPAMVAVFGAVVMLLWNVLLPQIFAFPQISYLQAAGLLILSRLLFSGIGGGRRNHALYGRDRLHHNELREKWMNMSEEERRKFIEKEKDFFKFNRDFSRFHDFFTNGEKPEQSGV